MTRHDNFHSTVVSWLKVALPLVALAIVSTLFLFSRTIDPSDAIPFAEVDIEDRVREPRLTQPTWAGVTDDGAALTIAADEARPDNGTTAANANGIVADLQTPDGGSAQLVAKRGLLDQNGAALTVDGGVTITTSTGYRMNTEAMTAMLDRTSLISQGAVNGEGPAGHIEAGSMEITQDQGDAASYLLVFKKGVKLLYLPKSQ